MKAFWNTKDWSQKGTSFLEQFVRHLLLMLQSMLNSPKNGGDSRKLMKVKEPEQHFGEQCGHYVPEQNIITLMKTE